MISVVKCKSSEWQELRILCIDTFVDTYGDLNTPDNLQGYLNNYFSEDQVQEDLAHDNKEFWVVKDQGKMIGYLQLNYNNAQTEERGSGIVEIERIYIHPEYKGRGIGKHIITHAVNIAKEKANKILWLGVWDQNQKAIQFYERYGFEKRGTHKFMLGDDVQNDWIMELDL